MVRKIWYHMLWTADLKVRWTKVAATWTLDLLIVLISHSNTSFRNQVVECQGQEISANEWTQSEHCREACIYSQPSGPHLFNFCVVIPYLGTNLIHDFTAVTFSVKLAFFHEKLSFLCFREIPWNPWFFVNFNAFTFIYEGFQSFINSFFADFAVCYVSHFSTK